MTARFSLKVLLPVARWSSLITNAVLTRAADIVLFTGDHTHSARYMDSVTKSEEDSTFTLRENAGGWNLMENSKGVMVSRSKLSDSGLSDHAIS